MPEWLTRLACLVLVVLLGSVERVLLVVEHALLALAFLVGAVRAALGAVCGALWGRVYP